MWFPAHVFCPGHHSDCDETQYEEASLRCFEPKLRPKAVKCSETATSAPDLFSRPWFVNSCDPVRGTCDIGNDIRSDIRSAQRPPRHNRGEAWTKLADRFPGRTKDVPAEEKGIFNT